MKEEKLYPFKLDYVTKSPIWGGTRLPLEWGKTAPEATVGESWELTVRQKENCKVTNGAYAGRVLGELIREDDRILGEGYGDGFPLLIKLIDPGDKLSVQVHPDDSYASRVENDRGKTEMWVIVDPAPDAELIMGLADGMTRQDFAGAVRAGKTESVLKRVRVREGDVYFIPAGMPHAIGKGAFLAEIQQNCDLTYRIFDYNRRGADGSLRELHVEKAMDVVRPFTGEEVNAIRFSRSGGKPAEENILADCQFFRVRKLNPNGKAVILPDDGSMRHLLCIGGELILTCGGISYPVKRGDSYLIPRSLTGLTLSGEGTVLSSAPYPKAE